MVPPGNGFPLVWVTEHEEEGETGVARRLRFWQRVDGRIKEIGDFPDNYLVTITEVAWPGRVVFLGTERYPKFGGLPVSTLRSFEIVCSL